MMLPVPFCQISHMAWKMIRLELARTPHYPQGSPAHAYVMRLPVDDNGVLEKHILRDPDQRPVVRRFWPGEADREGVVIPKGRGWVFSYSPGESDDETLFHLENHPIAVGQYLTITEADGEKLPFRVTSCHD
jgi:hypothetical protein